MSPTGPRRTLAAAVVVAAFSAAVGVHLAIHGSRATVLDGALFLDATLRAMRVQPAVPILAVRKDAQLAETARVGDVATLRWDARQAKLTLVNSAGQLWASRANEVFVSAARSESAVVDSHGNFMIRNRILSSCTMQRLDSIEASVAEDGSPEALLQGGFDDVGECRALTWQLRFMQSGDRHVRFVLELEPRGLADQVQLAGDLPSDVSAAWGLGVQFRHFNLRGHCVPAFVTEQGIGRGAPETWPVTGLLNFFAGGAGGNDYTTYAASASVLLSSGSGVFLENSEFSLWDLGSGGCMHTNLLSGGRFGATAGTSTETLSVTVHSSTMAGRLFVSEARARNGDGGDGIADGGFVSESRPLRQIEMLTALTGRQKPLPAWADQGLILALQGGTEVVRNKTKRVVDAGVPVTALWLQDWVGKRHTLLGERLWWNWALDHKTYGGWDELRRTLHPIRLLTYINPMLSDVSEAPEMASASISDGASLRWRRNLLEEALRNGYLVETYTRGQARRENKKRNATPYMVEVAGYYAAMIDLSNPAARSWARGVIRSELLGSGASGWMADFGEALPCDGIALHAAQTAPCAFHNQYPAEWAQLNQEAVQEAGLEDEVFYFSRSAFTKSPGLSTLFWLGDQMTSWDKYDGIGSAVTGAVGGGMSGFSLTHSDVGGYTGANLQLLGLSLARVVRGKELLLRWAELCVFSGAVMRSHEGLLPVDNHQIWDDDDTLASFRKYVKMFVALRPYRRQLMDQAATRGWPLVRHPVLHFPSDPVLLADRSRLQGGLGRVRQFMLGADLMVVPVIAPDVDTVMGYLPRGSWVSVWTGETIALREGRWQELPAPLGQPAVWARQGADSFKEVSNNLRAALTA